MQLPTRKRLPHIPPPWVELGSIYFITVCCEPRDMNQLCHEENAKHIFDTIAFRHNQQTWYVYVFLLMPDHIHALVCPSPEKPLQQAVAQWKEYTAKKIGIHWQRDFFDHRIRNDESWQEKATYIQYNPVRKGLVMDPSDWPYVWIPDR